MLTESVKTWQLLNLTRFNIHVGLKCKDEYASRNFRDEYKKNSRFLGIFKEFPNKKKPNKLND